jgi:hypothetical protein
MSSLTGNNGLTNRFGYRCMKGKPIDLEAQWKHRFFKKKLAHV